MSHALAVVCPKCGVKFEWHDNMQNLIAGGEETYFKDLPPKNCDISFCVQCGSVGIYIDGRVVRVIEEDLPENVQAQIAVIRKAWEKVVNNENVSS